MHANSKHSRPSHLFSATKLVIVSCPKRTKVVDYCLIWENIKSIEVSTNKTLTKKHPINSISTKLQKNEFKKLIKNIKQARFQF